MNSFALAMLLVFFPISLQILIGSLALAKKIKFHFGTVTLLSSLILLVCIYVGIGLVNDAAVSQGVRCGMPEAAFLFFGFMMLMLQLLVIIVQLIVTKIKRCKQKRL